MVTQDNNVYIMTTSNEKIPLNYKLNFGKQNCSTIELQELNKSDGIHKISYLLDYKKENQKLGKGYLNKHGRRQQIEIDVNTDLKLSEITGLKMYFFTGLNAALHVVPCNLSYDMICQKF